MAKDLQGRMESKAPMWALSVSGTILAISMALKIAGLDFASPLNLYFSSQAKVAEIRAMREAQGEQPSKELENKIKELDQRLDNLEEVHGKQLERLQQIKQK